jgi:hypothetical protein
MTCYSLSASSLVRSLSAEFNREIGLKSPTLMGLSHLGMRVIKELLMLWRQRFPSKKSSHNL